MVETQQQQEVPQTVVQPTAEESSKTMGILMHIQELFYKKSSHKDGAKAGKVNKEQLKEILLACEQFDFTGQDVDLRSFEYMKLLDTDKDEHVGFFDFLQPIIHVVPPELVTAFTQDQRFKQETFNELRLAFDSVKKPSQSGTIECDVVMLESKLQAKGVEQFKQLKRAFHQLLHLVKHQEGTHLNTTDFHVGVTRLEKRALFTFASKLYQEEEVRLRGLSIQNQEQFVPDFALRQSVETAIADENCQLADAKGLLRQMQAKVDELQTRLEDYEDTSQQISPSQLPQTQSKPQDLWTRMRRCMPSFIDVVLDTTATISDTSYLTMSDDVQKKVINDLNSEIEHTRQFKHRYDKMVDQLAKTAEDKPSDLSGGQVTVLNKNLQKQRNDKQKLLNQQNREIQNLKNQNRVYKEFSDGKLSKGDLKVIIDKSQQESSEFAQVKLRKVKVEKIRNEAINPFEAEQDDQPKSMAALKALFGGQAAPKGPNYEIKRTVLEEGNLADLKAKKLKQQQKDDASNSDSSAEEEVEEEKFDDPSAKPATAQQAALDGSSAPSQSFIQILFESQIKRKLEEDSAKSAAGLSAFKATGNAMQDAFRRMIEKKMYEKVHAELAKKKEEDETYKKEIEIRTAQREKELNEEKRKLVAENEIRLQSAHEARNDAEHMAKTVTVTSMLGVAKQVDVKAPEAAQQQESPEVYQQRINHMLIQNQQMELTATSVQAFDSIWSNPKIAHMGTTPQGVKDFSHRMLNDSAYRQEQTEQIKQIFIAKDKNENGIIDQDEGLEFIKEAMAQLIHQGQMQNLTEAECAQMQVAINSLDPENDCFNLDEFMRSVMALCAFNLADRSNEDTFAIQAAKGPQPLPKMIDNAFVSTKQHIDTIRNQIEVQRLELLQEKESIEQRRAELEFDRDHLDKEKKEFDEQGAKSVAATVGQALLVEMEVKRRLKEEKDRQDYEQNAKKQGGLDHDVRALRTFQELMERKVVDYENATEDDALADAMKAAYNLDEQKILMRYKRLKQEVLKRDPLFTGKVMRNYFTCIRKVGVLAKKSEGFFGNWQTRFNVLSNAGLVYFKVEHMENKEDLTPQGFKPLNDFVVQEVSEEETGRPHCFRVTFCKGAAITHPMLVAAPTEHDRKEWINALRHHQIQTLEDRAKLFEKKLERSGIRVPRASILVSKGFNAPNQQVAIARTQSELVQHNRPMARGSDQLIEVAAANGLQHSQTTIMEHAIQTRQPASTMMSISEEPGLEEDASITEPANQ